MLSDMFHINRSSHTDLNYGSYRLPNLEVGLTAGVTGQQGMLTHPRHLILPLLFPEVRVTLVVCRLFHLPDVETDCHCGFSRLPDCMH
jgi:hypothetical protein